MFTLTGLVLSVLCIPAPRAHCDEAARVLLLPLPRDPFAERLRAELAGVGLQVVESVQPARRDDSLEVQAGLANARAAVRTTNSRKGVEVWISERASGRPMLRHLVVDERAAEPDAALVVLQTVELLRAGLLAPAQTAAPEPPRAVPPAPAAETPVLPVLPVLSVLAARGGLGVMGSAGGAGSMAAAYLAMAVLFRRSLALDLWGAFPLTEAVLEDRDGRAQVRAFLAGVGPSVRLSWGRTWALALGAGVAITWLGASGTTSAPLLASSENLVTGAGYGRFLLSRQLVSGWHLGIECVTAVAATRGHIVVAGRELATFGRPVVSGFIVTEARW